MPNDKVRPKLRDLDDMFNQMSNASSQGADTQQSGMDKALFTVCIIPFDVIDDFSGHPFKLYDGERKTDMIDSIRDKGILLPLILRPKDGNRYEILSGHNRKYCGIEAGLIDAPAIIKDGISDNEALMYVVETNLMQRSFTDMSHSEKAAVLSMQHSKLFSQGKRTDILEELKSLEKAHNNPDNSTFTQLGSKLRTNEKIAETYSLSRNTVARYLRIERLVPTLKQRLDTGEIPFIPAVTLSFLKPQEQNQVDNCIKLNGFKVDIKKSDFLKQNSEKGDLDEDLIYLILNGEMDTLSKKKRSPKFKIKPKIYSKYFKPNQNASEVESIIEKALEFYFQYQEKTKD